MTTAEEVLAFIKSKTTAPSDSTTELVVVLGVLYNATGDVLNELSARQLQMAEFEERI